MGTAPGCDTKEQIRNSRHLRSLSHQAGGNIQWSHMKHIAEDTLRKGRSHCYNSKTRDVNTLLAFAIALAADRTIPIRNDCGGSPIRRRCSGSANHLEVGEHYVHTTLSANRDWLGRLQYDGLGELDVILDNILEVRHRLSARFPRVEIIPVFDPWHFS